MNGPQAGEALAARQAALVAALLGAGPDPAGFDPAPLAAAREALAHKRAGQVARHWPALARALADDWVAACAAHTSIHPASDGQRTGWDIAHQLAVRGALPRSAATELALARTRWRPDATGALTARSPRWPRLARVSGVTVLRWGRRTARWGGDRP